MTIDECLSEAETTLKNQRKKGGNPVWSPKLIEALRESTKGLKKMARWTKIDPVAAMEAKLRLENIGDILNG